MTMELPEHLRTGPLAEAAQKALAEAANMASASNSVPRISLKGRQFRLIEGGEEVMKVHGDTLDVVILGIEPGPGLMAKAWYENGYTPGANSPPDCLSDDGISPPSWVKNRQSDKCATCRHNQFGTGRDAQGRATKGKACRDSKRAWVKLADTNVDKAGKPLELEPFADRTMYGLNVTVASLKSFSEHGRVLAGFGVAPAVCVTRLTMGDGDFPFMEFSLVAWLDADTAPESLKIANDKPWRMFKAVGLALAGPEGEGGSKVQLPGQLPAHLQPQTQPKHGADDAVVVERAPAKTVSDKDIDDEVAKF